MRRDSCAALRLSTRELCTNGEPCSLNNITSVETPETCGLRALCHAALVTVLWSSLPLGAPRHRAPPLLGQVEVKTGYMSRHIVSVPQYGQHPVRAPTKALFTGVMQHVSGTYQTIRQDATAVAGESIPPWVQQARPPQPCREE